MTEPEQWAFWSAMNYDVVRKLAENEKRHDVRDFGFSSAILYR